MLQSFGGEAATQGEMVVSWTGRVLEKKEDDGFQRETEVQPIPTHTNIGVCVHTKVHVGVYNCACVNILMSSSCICNLI